MFDQIQFITGGLVPHNSQVYIQRRKRLKKHRTIEQETLAAIVNQRQDVTIIGPRQVGKTSLLDWLSATTNSRYGYATVWIDLSPLNIPDINESVWVKEFCNRLLRQLQPFMIDSQLAFNPPSRILELEQYWLNLTRFINPNTILILLDEANSVPAHIIDSFYSNIRKICIQRRSYNPNPNRPLQRYIFAFAGVFEPERLIKNRQNSPFNISQIFRLPDFSQAESRRLLSKLTEKHHVELPISVMESIHYWTDGHPYLTQHFASLIDDELSYDAKSAINQELVNDELVSIVEEEASDNIDHTGKRTLQYLRDLDEIEFLKDILNGELEPFTRTDEMISQLELFGAIKKGSDTECKIRNPIIERALKRALRLGNGSKTADYKQVDYYSAIVAILNDSNIIAGTGFLVQYSQNLYIVTCAHVTNKQEGEIVYIKPFNSTDNIKAIVMWMRTPTKKKATHWIAEDDITILKVETSLLADMKPQILFPEIGFEGKSDCYGYAYLKSFAPRGSLLKNISCANLVDGGFVELKQEGPIFIESGASGSPLSDVEGKIIGMIQSTKPKMQVAYLTPVGTILNVLEKMNKEFA